MIKTGINFVACNDIFQCRFFQHHEEGLLTFFTITFALASDVVPDADVAHFNDFSIELFTELIKGNNDNLAMSAFTVRNGIGMTALGARGETAKQIKNGLKLEESDEHIKQLFKSVLEHMKGAEYLSMETAVKAYLADGIAIEPEFKKIVTEYFNADVENVNFHEAKATAEKINSWVEEKTHHKIKGLIQENSISALTRFILVNTLYFRGRFLHPFAHLETEKKDFHISKTETVKVDMMKMSAHLSIAKNSELGVTMVALPYQNKKAELIIILPDDIEKTQVVEENIMKLWHNRNFTKDYVKVYLPRFRVESTLDMIPPLKKMGITNLFSEPDLSGISKEDIVVSAVKQKTYIDVNELGTEAASATAVEGITRSLPGPRGIPQIFRADRPFVFAILYDGICIFAGRVHKF
ncbi:hypothetical protein WA026_005618 [Henosepilachna vigintioctopunctata]|uniref:Serpin domain-containing protein n=1 Tax=Henosepilachna vigintioctopunctata TaxID=420089 RepID=A0AAW1TWX9_9CUCU